jgi:phospholipid/cholesterol/gamma-HCH transport system substrate-binding protein
MSPQRRNVIVGVVVLAGLCALAWMLLTFAGDAAGIFVSNGLTATLTTDRADGLAPGSLVFYRGVDVGRVTKVRRLPDNEHVEIGLELDRDPPLPRNLVGLIKTNSALGSAAAVMLEVDGLPDKIPLASGAELPAKYVGLELFPPEFAQVALEMHQQQLVLHLDQTVQSIRDQAVKVGLVLDSVQKIVSDPKIQDQVHQAIANLHDASESAAHVGAKFEKLTDKFGVVADNTNSHINDISRQIGDDTEKLGKVLDQFQVAAASINDGKGTAGKLVTDPKLYDSLTDTVKTLNSTILDLKRLISQWEQEGVALKMGK